MTECKEGGRDGAPAPRDQNREGSAEAPAPRDWSRERSAEW